MYGFDGRVLPQCSGDGRNIRPAVGGQGHLLVADAIFAQGSGRGFPHADDLFERVIGSAGGG